MTLENATRNLLLIINESKTRFEKITQKPEKTESLFYERVKPAFEEGIEQATIWKPLAQTWLLKEKPKYIHHSQIDTTLEHIEQLVLQSFYKDVNNQRFYNMYSSAEYILKSILNELEQG